ncbi:MAG: PQQ-binding-like beta-propeller repeat protein, partial [Planctomycetales bacterium]|nr:PQQ-binding-like beta-propeller repeat protein [Planctomycetales bacterium]
HTLVWAAGTKGAPAAQLLDLPLQRGGRVPVRPTLEVIDRERIYVVGEHSNLYTLSGDDFSCLGVYSIGHNRGSVVVPPALVLNKLVVAENSGAQTSRLHCIALDDTGVPRQTLAQERLEGTIVTPLLPAQRRLACVTTLGAVEVFEIGGGQDASAFTPLAQRDPSPGPPAARFGTLTQAGNEANLWLAGRELSKLAILPTGNRLPMRSLDDTYEGDAFDAPLQVVDGLLVHVRRPASGAGLIVGAIDVAQSRNRWQTSIAAPAAGVPSVDASTGRLVVGDAAGRVYRPDRQKLASRVDSEALTASSPGNAAFDAALDLGKGRIVIGATGGDRLLLAGPSGEVRAVSLAGSLTCPLVAWGNGFVACNSSGQVEWRAAEDGSPLAQPFQPELAAEQKVMWLEPTVAGDGPDATLVVADPAGNLYAIRPESEPTPHLAASVSGKASGVRLTTRLAVLGGRVVVGDEEGKLSTFDVNSLDAQERVAIPFELAWGPYAIDGGVLLASSSGDLLCLDAQLQPRWNVKLGEAAPVGLPLQEAARVTVALPQGSIFELDAATGDITWQTQLNQWLRTGPFAFGKLRGVGAADGAMLFFNRQ